MCRSLRSEEERRSTCPTAAPCGITSLRPSARIGVRRVLRHGTGSRPTLASLASTLSSPASIGMLSTRRRRWSETPGPATSCLAPRRGGSCSRTRITSELRSGWARLALGQSEFEATRSRFEPAEPLLGRWNNRRRYRALVLIARASGFSGRTGWARAAQTPLREFLRTETGGAAVLLGATLAALAWANIDSASYERLWTTVLSIRLGDGGVVLDLRQWVNSGLMTLFFFVIGLEARREFDLGELRERRRFALPLMAGLGGLGGAAAAFFPLKRGPRPTRGVGGPPLTRHRFSGRA